MSGRGLYNYSNCDFQTVIPKFHDLDLLKHISKMLTLTNRETFFEDTVRLIGESLDAQHVFMMFRTGVAQESWTHIAFELGDKAAIQIYPSPYSEHFHKLVVEEGIEGWVLQHGKTAYIPNTSYDERWKPFSIDNNFIGSVVCVPMFFAEALVGILTILHPTSSYFTHQHVTILETLANICALSVSNSMLLRKVQRNQDQLEAMLHAMPDELIILDDALRIILVNHSAAHLFNETPNALAGRSLEEFVYIDSLLRMVIDTIAGTSKPDQLWTLEGASEQTGRDYLITITTWRDVNSSQIGYVIVRRDITTLRDLSRFKDEMLQLVSHDLRSPLSLIMGYASLIDLDVNADTPFADYVQAIQQAAERMKNLLDEMLRVQQIRRSPKEMLQMADLYELTTDVLGQMESVAQQNQLMLIKNVQINPQTTAWITPSLISEAMANLISNAMKYTPAGGDIEVSVYTTDSKFFFEVVDTGIGIPPEALPRLFDAFFRVKQSSLSHIEGRGLGLSLVKSIIERHGGNVSVESTIGVGSKFGFWIPLNTSVSEDEHKR